MMKLKLKSKMLSVLLCILILMQSCQVYRSGTLSKAVEESTKTKVLTTTGESLKFQKVIYSENDKYVGLKKKNGKLTEFELDEKFVKEVKVKNRTMSIVNTVVLSSIVFVAVLGTGISVFGWLD